MVFPLIPLAMYAPAAITAAAAAAKGLSGGRGQRILQGGRNVANRGLTSLQNVTQPYMQNIANRFMQSNPVSQALPLDTASRPTDSIAYNAAKGIVKGSEWILGSEEKKEEIATQFFEMFGIDMEEALEQAGQELLEEEDKKKIKEPEIPEKKKGGYVKKQRKRKHYRASSFVKMKKKNKKKYIKT